MQNTVWCSEAQTEAWQCILKDLIAEVLTLSLSHTDRKLIFYYEEQRMKKQSWSAVCGSRPIAAIMLCSSQQMTKEYILYMYITQNKKNKSSISINSICMLDK